MLYANIYLENKYLKKGFGYLPKPQLLNYVHEKHFFGKQKFEIQSFISKMGSHSYLEI